jgi:hypothetical protein
MTWEDVLRTRNISEGTLRIVTEGHDESLQITAVTRDGQVVHITHEKGTLTIPASWPLQRLKDQAVAVVFPSGMPTGYLHIMPAPCACPVD